LAPLAHFINDPTRLVLVLVSVDANDLVVENRD